MFVLTITKIFTTGLTLALFFFHFQTQKLTFLNDEEFVEGLLTPETWLFPPLPFCVTLKVLLIEL